MRVNSSKEHAPLLFDDTQTYSEREIVYTNRLRLECELDYLTVGTSSLVGSGKGLFTKEDIPKGARYGYTGKFLRSSIAHDLSDFFKNELLSMKCNTQVLDINDKAAVKEYFKNEDYLKVNTWELNEEQKDAIKEVFRRVAADNCIGKELLINAEDAEFIPVHSFLHLENNELVDRFVLEIFCSVISSHYGIQTFDFILASQSDYDELFKNAPQPISIERQHDLSNHTCLFWILNAGTDESPTFFLFIFLRRTKQYVHLIGSMAAKRCYQPCLIGGLLLFLMAQNMKK